MRDFDTVDLVQTPPSPKDAPEATQSAGRGTEDLRVLLADLSLTPDTRAAIETLLAVTMASEQAQSSEPQLSKR